ncbi:hypothetical protein AVEN_35110-1 [Araneus ventricosus]|uniref:Uncharacterized protein n=1 Tax=Araneus ventricosus TaxID=182803 RepID=A0A4Y2I6D6_ARAVE|nr:hypothetical protein AVEN_35110-1 [Araneus ventricosus]
MFERMLQLALTALRTHMRDTTNPHATIEVERDLPKLNVFCAMFIHESTVIGVCYLAMLQIWLFPLLEEEAGHFILQQDGAPRHWHLFVDP